MAHVVLAAVLVLSFAVCPSIARAQGPAVEVEVRAGRAWFLDESAIPYSVAGGAARWWLTPRLALGPEFTYLVGPGSDRNQTITGNITYAFRDAGVRPFVVAGAGLFRHSERFVGEPFASSEGGFTAGLGLHIPLRAGWYMAPAMRFGWEPHTRIDVAVGRRF